VNEESNVIQYPGYMEPWVDQTPPYDSSDDLAQYDHANQQDRSDPDPEPFEFHFHAADVLVYLDIDVLPDYNSWVVEDEDLPAAEYAYEPWVDQAGVAAILNDSSGDYDLEFGLEDDDAVVEWAFEPWTDVAVVAIINDGSTDYDISQPTNEELDATTETAFDPAVDAFNADDVFVSINDPEYDSDAIGANDDDEPAVEFSYEPWVDLTVAIVNDGDEYDTTQPANDEDDPSVEFSFDPQWAAIPVSLSDYATDFAAGDQLYDEPIADAFEYQFEPWSSIPAVVLVNDPATDYDTAQPANADDDPVFEFSYEPWVDTPALIDFPDVDLAGFVADDDAAFTEASYEPWVDQSASTVIDAPEFNTVALTEDDELQLFESSMEAWAAVNIDAPDFNADVQASDEDIDFIDEWYFEVWQSIPPIVLVYAVANEFDATWNVNDVDDPVFEFSFEPWTDYTVATVIPTIDDPGLVSSSVGRGLDSGSPKRSTASHSVVRKTIVTH